MITHTDFSYSQHPQCRCCILITKGLTADFGAGVTLVLFVVRGNSLCFASQNWESTNPCQVQNKTSIISEAILHFPTADLLFLFPGTSRALLPSALFFEVTLLGSLNLPNSVDFLQLFSSPMGLLLAHSSCGAYLVGRTQNGHKSFSESINKRDKRERMATCCFLEGLYTFFRGNYLWIKKNPPPKHQCFGFCARLLRAEENICHVPGCPFNWKNTMTGQFPAQPWISFLLWATITKHNLWKRALFWEKKRKPNKKTQKPMCWAAAGLGQHLQSTGDGASQHQLPAPPS